jgi:uncharacterized protein (TIGR03118 family)
MKRRTRSVIVAASLGAGIALAAGQAKAFYQQTNLVSDLPGVAQFPDADLVNPWGMSHSPTGPIWVSDNHTGLSTLYNGAGVKQGLVVTIPPPTGGTPPAAPTGQVFNNAGAGTFNSAVFMFATEDGTISRWNGGTAATLSVDNSAAGAVYKGLAIAGTGASARIYAANFNSGKVDTFDNTFTPILSGAFQDSTIPAGFAPFNIQNVGGNLVVTYAKQDALKHDDVSGPGNGYVDLYDQNGNLIKKLVSGGTLTSPLNSPWGVALAPSDFGTFSGDLLIGNFGDGKINAFDPNSGAFLGTLTDASGNPIVIDGLWGLLFGNGGNGGPADDLFFTAGIPGPNGNVEDHGLFGFLAVPEPSTFALLIPAMGLLALTRRRA